MDFNQIIDRRGTDSAKWNRYGDDVLPMWLADMDFRAPEVVINALQERVAHGIFGYGFPSDRLKEAITAHLKSRHNWDVEKADLAFVSGVVSGFTHAIYALTEPGDRVLIQTPAYPPFLSAPRCTGRTLVINQLTSNCAGYYEVDFDDFEAKIASGVKLFILCNPQNPSGRVFRREELEKMAEICLRSGTLICADEIHADLVYSGFKHIPIASLSKEVSKNTVTYFAPSKTFNVAGFSTSVYVTTDPEMQKTLSQSMSMLLGHPNILGLHAAHVAYRDGGPWLDAILEYLLANRDHMVDVVTKKMPGVRVCPPEGTFLGWLDCRDLELDTTPQQFFLKEAKVGLNDGCDFGEAGDGFVRLNFGCPRALLDQALNQMIAAIAKRK